MPVSAWIMLFLGCVVLYGGLLMFILIAVKNQRQKKKNMESRIQN